MAGGLRYESGREMPPGMQELMAKRIIEEIVNNAQQVVETCVQVAEKTVETIVENESLVMLAVIKTIDADCSFCKYAGGKLPCEADSIVISCAGCQYDCPCNGCRENSKYEWCGAEEAIRRLPEIGEEYAKK